MASIRTDEEWIETLTRTRSLAQLAELFGTESVHEAYFDAKDVWKRAVGKRQERTQLDGDFPGTTVDVDGHVFHVHGVTHAGTDAERSYLREQAANVLDRDAIVYCEQGIRPLYFEDFPGVCAMDDYRWALNECASLETDTHLDLLPETGFDAVLENVDDVATQFREATYSLIESGTAIYGERFESALGDVAAGFLLGNADVATGRSYEAFSLSREASRNPDRLGDLQRYYERAFLPQPLEREWLRRHDPELEIVSHARNERMADYAVYHNEAVEEVHLVVGAAHQPGIVYYLERYSEGRQSPESFQLF